MAKTSNSYPAGRLIGYARVSTEDQDAAPQLDELWAADCETVLQDHTLIELRPRDVES